MDEKGKFITETKTQKPLNTKAMLIVGLILMVIVGITAFSVAKSMLMPQTVAVSNVFADINGDGKLDLIVSGQVIINTDQSSDFLASQAK